MTITFSVKIYKSANDVSYVINDNELVVFLLEEVKWMYNRVKSMYGQNIILRLRCSEGREGTDGEKGEKCMLLSTHAPAGNRTRGPTMATLDFTTKPLMLATPNWKFSILISVNYFRMWSTWMTSHQLWHTGMKQLKPKTLHLILPQDSRWSSYSCDIS